MGVVECISHKMIEPFQVLYEKPSKYISQTFQILSVFIWNGCSAFSTNFYISFSEEIVAQFKFTVLLTPSGINLVTGLPFDTSQFESENHILDAELKELVLSEIPNKSAKHKAKKAANKGGASNTTTPAADAKDDAKADDKAAK